MQGGTAGSPFSIPKEPARKIAEPLATQAGKHRAERPKEGEVGRVDVQKTVAILTRLHHMGARLPLNSNATSHFGVCGFGVYEGILRYAKAEFPPPPSKSSPTTHRKTLGTLPKSKG
jgi:hypothetical protein